MSNELQYAHIKVEYAHGVAHVTLNSPDKLNALGIGPQSNRAEIARAFAACDADPSVRSILLSGAGRAFCSGGDLGGTVGGPIDPTEQLIQTYRFNAALNQFYAGIRRVEKPIIAAVNGYCLGAGLGLAVHCDFIVAADDAQFGLPEGRIGHPGATELVPIIGRAWAKFLILTGELIDAYTAKDIGLVLAVTPADEMRARASELARRIARMPQQSVIMNKASVDKTAEAMGEAAGRVAGRAQDVMTKFLSQAALAPCGRTFASILAEEGMGGLKRARDQQYSTPWLSPHQRKVK